MLPPLQFQYQTEPAQVCRDRASLNYQRLLNPDGTSSNSYDHIIIGAGIAGSALASRLSRRHRRCPAMLINAGKESKDKPLVFQPLVAPMLRGSEGIWKCSPKASWGPQGI